MELFCCDTVILQHLVGDQNRRITVGCLSKVKAIYHGHICHFLMRYSGKHFMILFCRNDLYGKVVFHLFVIR